MLSIQEITDFRVNSVLEFLSKTFKISFDLAVEYCKKCDFPYGDISVSQICKNEELLIKYFDLCDYISSDIRKIHKEKVDYILSFYSFPEVSNTVSSFIPYFTVSGSSIRTYMDTVNKICDKLRKGNELSSDDYEDVDFIFDGPKEHFLRIPSDMRKILINGIDEGYKMHYFEKNIEEILKKFDKDQDGVYIPRLNGVPLKELPLDKDKLLHFFYEDFESVSDILAPLEQSALIVLINSIPYFNSVLIPQNIKKKITVLDNIEKENNILNNLTDFFNKRAIENFELDNKKDDGEEDSKDYHLNEAFKKSIIEKIPPEYNDLEKTLYVYYVLCYLLSYDNYYYFINEQVLNKHIFYDESKIKNTDRSSMNAIDEKNNEVTCYQFASALKDVLDELGIRTSKLHYNKNNTQRFVDAHQEIQILVDGMLLDADSTRRGADSDDLAFFKLGKISDGIRCEMFSKDEQEQFFKAKNKVSERVIKDLKIEFFRELDEDLKAFNDIYPSCEDKSKKMSFIAYEMSKINLSRVDSLALFVDMFYKVFNSDERSLIKYETTIENEEWAIDVNIGEFNYHYDFDTKTMICNDLSVKKM